MKYRFILLNLLVLPLAQAQFLDQVKEGLKVTKPHVIRISNELLAEGVKQKWSIEQKRKAAKNSNPNQLTEGWQYQKASETMTCKEFLNGVLDDGGLPKVGESKQSTNAKYSGTMDRSREQKDPPVLVALRADKSSSIDAAFASDAFKIKARYQQIPFSTKLDGVTRKRIYGYHQRFIKPRSTNFKSELFDSLEVDYDFEVISATSPKTCRLKTIRVVGESKDSALVAYNLDAKSCVDILKKVNEKDKRWVELLTVASDKNTGQGNLIMHDTDLITTETSDLLGPFCSSAIGYFGELQDGSKNLSTATREKERISPKASAQ